MVLNYDKFIFRENWDKRLAICGINLWTQKIILYIIEFKNINTGIHFNNKKDYQKLKYGGKEIK